MAKKTTKKRAEAKASAPTLASLKKQAQENYKGSKVQRFLFKFEREHYEEKLSQSSGFGAHDLKQPYFDLYNYLLTKHKKNLVVKLISMSTMTVELWVNE
jgi:hypothetical protein